jgi:hypothetical protein
MPARACSLETVPRTERSGFIPPWTRSPTESLTTSRPSDPSVGPTPLRFRRPATTSPGLAPYWSGYRPPRPGPALRFSQPPGGFLAHPSSRPCFVPLPPLGSPLPSEPHLTGIAAPLSGPPAPLRSSPRACVRRRGLVTPGFADALPGLPGLLPVSPRSYGCPFSVRAMVRPASRSPWTARGGLTPDHAVHPLRSLDPPAKSAPPTPRVSPQEWPCSPGIPPLQSLLHPPLGT